MTPEILKAVQEERERCAKLVEAPLPGLIEFSRVKGNLGYDMTYVGGQIRALQDAAKSIRESREASECREICKGCGQKIDPECCGCGDSKKNHGSSLLVGHNFVPMGCDCHRAGRGDASGKRT